MKEILPNIFAVEVPEDIINVAIIDGAVVDNWADGEWIPIFKLPPGSYTFLFCSNDATLNDWYEAGIPESVWTQLEGNEAIIRKN